MKLTDLDPAATGPVQGTYPDDDDDAPVTAAELLTELEDLIERPELQYARDTLEGIYERAGKRVYPCRHKLYRAECLKGKEDDRVYPEEPS